MLRKYLVALLAGLYCIAIHAEFGSDASTFGGIKYATPSSSAREKLKIHDYYNKVASFNEAVDYYLQNCRVMKQKNQWQRAVEFMRSAKKRNPQVECERALETIKDFLEYAKTYYSPDTLQKRIRIETAFREDAINARQDLTDLEKEVLLTCFGFSEDNYAQVYFSYKRQAQSDAKIKSAIAAGSKDKDIMQEYLYIVAREKEVERVASIKLLLNNLALSTDSTQYKNAMSKLKKDFNFFVEVSQQVKSMPWVTYRMTGKPLQGNRVYPGLFKAFIDESKVTQSDRRIIEALTQVAHDLPIPTEPSYEQQMAAGIDNKIGEGCSIGWALLRYAAYKAAINADNLKSLTATQKALVVDEMLIRCGNREERTVNRRVCPDMIIKLEPLLKEFEIKILDVEPSYSY